MLPLTFEIRVCLYSISLNNLTAIIFRVTRGLSKHNLAKNKGRRKILFICYLCVIFASLIGANCANGGTFFFSLYFIKNASPLDVQTFF